MSWYAFGTDNAPIHGRARRKTVSFAILEGSSNAAVAQWIEYWPPKPRVAGPIPASRTRNIKVNQRVTRFGWWLFFYWADGLLCPVGPFEKRAGFIAIVRSECC
jgi:hypothetical protein